MISRVIVQVSHYDPTCADQDLGQGQSLFVDLPSD